MKANKVLFLVLLLVSSSMLWAQQKVTLPSELLASDLPNNMGKNFVKAGEEDGDKYFPNDVYEEMYNAAEQLYTGGFAKLEYLELFNSCLKRLKKFEEIRTTKSVDDDAHMNFVNNFPGDCNSEKSIDDMFTEIFTIRDSSETAFCLKYNCAGKVYSSEWTPFSYHPTKGLYHTLYTKAFAMLIDKVKNDPQLLAGEYEMASVQQCQSGLERLVYANYRPQNSCVAAGAECSDHGDCCSKNCIKDSVIDEKGRCAQEISCYTLLEPQQECGFVAPNKYNPYCKNALVLHQLHPDDYPAPPIDQKIEQCIETNLNTSEIGECTATGLSPTAGKPCCSEKIGNDGKCALKMTCDVCIQGGGKVREGEKCCKGYYKSLRGICIQDFPPLVLPETTKIEDPHHKIKREKKLIEKIWDFIMPSAHANELENPDGGGGGGGSTGSSGGGSTTGSSGSGSGVSNCISGVTCENNLTADQQDTIGMMTADCLGPDDNGNPKTQAAIDSCLADVSEYKNSLINNNIQNGVEGEQWDRAKYLAAFNMTAITSKTASDFDKCEFNSFNDSWRSASNLERNAEIVIRGFEYSFSGKGTVDFWLDSNGKSIYERAKKVVKNIRRFRTDMIKNYQEIDRIMACKCIAAMGPAKFPEKMGFFNSKCEEEKAQMSEDLSGADGTSSNQNLSKVEKDQAQASEVDLGASGVSHEKILMEYLNMRVEAQFERFNANAELETQLTELSDFIINNEWEQSWDSDPVFLYDFTVKRTAGWVSWAVAIVIIIVSVVLAVVTFGAYLAVVAVALAVGGLVGGLAANAIEDGRADAEERVREFTQGAAMKSVFGEGTDRHINDAVRRDWHKGCGGLICFTEHKDLTRQYIGPYFKTTDPKAKMGVTSVDDPKKICEIHASSRVCFRNVHITDYEGEGRFLLDAKFPEFVADNAYTKDSQFIEKVNQAYERGILALKALKPNGVKKTKWLESDHLTNEVVQKAFLIDSGNWMPEIFDDAKENKFKAGVKKYAKCIKLKDCGAQHLEEDEQDAFGYGFLFENDTDVNNFAAYVYQHHFKWPSLSASGVMRYPTMAMSSYFEAMVYNLRLIGSLAAQRGIQMGDLYDKYKSDWDKRKEDYKLGATAQMGGESKNVKYSKEFRMLFKRLNFRTGTGVEDFQGKNGELKTGSGSGLSKSELATLQNGVNKAMNAKLQAKKAEHYAATVGNTPRGKIKLAAQKGWMDKMSSPLNSMPLTVGGKQLGMLGNQSQNSNVATTKNTNKKVQSDTTASYKSSDFNLNTNFATPSYSSHSGSSSSGDNSVPQTGIRKSSADNSFLLDSAAKDQSLFQRDESDSLFKIVSKAYFRNLSLILVRNGSQTKRVTEQDLEFKRKKSLNKGKKAELKKLLED